MAATSQGPKGTSYLGGLRLGVSEMGSPSHLSEAAMGVTPGPEECIRARPGFGLGTGSEGSAGFWSLGT